VRVCFRIESSVIWAQKVDDCLVSRGEGKGRAGDVRTRHRAQGTRRKISWPCHINVQRFGHVISIFMFKALVEGVRYHGHVSTKNEVNCHRGRLCAVENVQCVRCQAVGRGNVAGVGGGSCHQRQ